MATVTITITDKPKGKLSLKIASDPAFPGPAAKDQTTTSAQTLGLMGLEAIGNICKTGKA